jgi:hypothetical protein
VSAGSIDGAVAGVLPSDKGEPVHIVRVVNGSKRPVREVVCKIEAIEKNETIRQKKAADVVGEMVPYVLGPGAKAETFVPQVRASTMPVLRAGHTGGFVWGFTSAQYPRLLSWVRFTDDAGLHWEVTTDLHLVLQPQADM